MFAFHFEVIFKTGEKTANATNPNIPLHKRVILALSLIIEECL